MAEESSNTEGTQGQTSEKAEESTAGKQQERTFTQAELDRVVSDRFCECWNCRHPHYARGWGCVFGGHGDRDGRNG